MTVRHGRMHGCPLGRRRRAAMPTASRNQGASGNLCWMVGGARVKGTAGAGSVRPGRRSAGELEAEVLAALWAAGRPLAPAEVHAELGPDLAYSTVTTILHRLYRKGVVTRHPSGRGNAYRPAHDEATHRAQAMHALLRQ